jgi:hypothetical protein
MQGKPGKPGIAPHIKSIRLPAWGPFVLSALLRDCWPDGTADRQPDAESLEWLRRAGPSSPTPVFAPCSCAAARCAVCN